MSSPGDKLTLKNASGLSVKFSTPSARAILPLTFLFLLNCLAQTSVQAQFRSSYARTSPRSSAQPARANQLTQGTQPTQEVAAGGVYPQFRSSFGTIRWLSEQMPLKVYISPGLSLDGIIDKMGAPATNVDNREHWPDLVASVLQNESEFKNLPTADGYSSQHREATIQGLNDWRSFQKEGLFSYK